MPTSNPRNRNSRGVRFLFLLSLSLPMVFTTGCFGILGGLLGGGGDPTGGFAGAPGAGGFPQAPGGGLPGDPGIGSPTGTGLPGAPNTGPSTAGPLTGNQQFSAVPPTQDGSRESFDQQVEQAMLQIVNQIRAQNGAGPLRLDPTLGRDAAQHSREMASQGTIYHGNFRGSAENVAQGFGSSNDPTGTARGIVDQYLNSPGHRANILNPSHSVAGFGTVLAPSGEAYNTQQFG